MNKEERAFHYLLDDYIQIPKMWEDYQIIKNAIEEHKQLKHNWNELKEWLSDKLYILNGILDLDAFEEQRLIDYRNVMNKVEEIESKE